MKTLSVQQPWATLLCAGIKDVENRSWDTTFRGTVLIHASSYWGADLFDESLPLPVFQEYQRIFNENGNQIEGSSILGIEGVSENEKRLVLLDENLGAEFNLLKTELAAQIDTEDTVFPSSAIVGSVDLIDIVRDSESPWAGEDSYHWVVVNPVLFAHPVRNVKGKLRLWEYDGPIDRTPKEMVTE